MHPAVPDRIGSLLRLVEIALHELGTGDDNLARLAGFCRLSRLRIDKPYQGV
jgi:hypothetical protein